MTVMVDYGGGPMPVEIPANDVLAEQERCTKIAEKMAAEARALHNCSNDDYDAGRAVAALEIATLIRSGK